MIARQPRYSMEEFVRRGNDIYERDIRPQVDNDQNRGKFVAIDIETGQWAINANELTAGDLLFARVPDAQTWMVRVGYGSLRRFGAGRPRRLA